MKILVTGGAGFIGSHVVDGYIEAGHEVVVVDNLFTGKPENINPKARFYLADVRDEVIAKIFEIERPDVVNHHAAQMSVPDSVRNPKFDADVNIMGILNLLQNSIKYGVKKFIFISTGGAIYGEADTIPTNEQTEPKPLSPYAITKFASENYLRFYHAEYGLNYTVLRYANIYGPRQVPHAEAGVVAIFMSTLKKGQLPTIFHYPEEPDGMTRDYCFVYDVVRANLLALDRANGETVNIGTSVETTTGELYRQILKEMRKQGYCKDSRFDNPNKGPARPGDLRRSALSNKKAKEILGWEPRYSLEMGIAETVKTEVLYR